MKTMNTNSMYKLNWYDRLIIEFNEYSYGDMLWLI